MCSAEIQNFRRSFSSNWAASFDRKYTYEMTAEFWGSAETEQRNGNDSLTLVDLEHLQEDEESRESGFVSPRELTKINFRSLIGHTDEVWKLSLYNLLIYTLNWEPTAIIWLKSC